MEIEIAVPGDDGRQALAEVLNVLESHPAMRGAVVRPAMRGAVVRPAPSQADERVDEPLGDLQGGMSTFEVVNAVLSQGSGYGALAVSLYAALRGRRTGGAGTGGHGSTVEVTRAGTRRSVTLDRDLSPGEIEQLLRTLEADGTGEGSGEGEGEGSGNGGDGSAASPQGS